MNPAAEHRHEISAVLETGIFWMQLCAQGKRGKCSGRAGHGTATSLHACRPHDLCASHGELSLCQVERVPAFCQLVLTQPSKGGGSLAAPVGHWLDMAGSCNI